MERATALELEQGDRVEHLATRAIYEVCGVTAKWRNKPNVFSIPVRLIIKKEVSATDITVITDRNLDDWIVLPTDFF